MIRRGDVAIVDVPYTDSPRSKARPAIIVQNDRDNQRLRKTLQVVGHLSDVLKQQLNACLKAAIEIV